MTVVDYWLDCKDMTGRIHIKACKACLEGSGKCKNLLARHNNYKKICSWLTAPPPISKRRITCFITGDRWHEWYWLSCYKHVQGLVNIRQQVPNSRFVLYTDVLDLGKMEPICDGRQTLAQCSQHALVSTYQLGSMKRQLVSHLIHRRTIS